jgi:N-methylhydantoinase B
MTSYDPIAAEVHRKAIVNLTNEMAITLIRTSGSPVVVEAKDFSTCLLDRGAEHLGFAAYVLGHFGSSLVGTEAVIASLEGADPKPGDGWLVNDPHTGGALHQGDVAVIMPTYYGDEHLGWSFANMHVLDIGGMGISGYAPGAHDVYQEGLRFPPTQIIRDGAIDEQWEAFIGANVRVPGPVLNDIRSMIAANNTAARKLGEIVDEYGIERHREYCEINKDLTESLLEERISAIPDGIYRTVDWNEFDGHGDGDRLLEMGLELEVEGSKLNLRFSGVPQIDAFVNSTRGAMIGQSMAAMLTTLAYGDLPVNGGIWRPINFDLGEPGTIVNSLPPAPVSNAHCEVGARAGKMTRTVLAEALSLSADPTIRSRVSSQAHDSFPGGAFMARNQHGSDSVMFYVDTAVGIGGPAQTVGDGQDAYGFTNMTGCGLADVETHEAADPVLFLWRRLTPNTGGAGETRGGQGMEQAFAIRYSSEAAGPSFNAAAQVPPRGFGGGAPGAAGRVHLVRETNLATELEAGRLPSREEHLGGRVEDIPSKVTHVNLMRDDVYVVSGGGGGGLGDPLLRDPAVVAQDVADRYVTGEVAKSVYGVVLDAAGGADATATQRQRDALREGRIMRAPTVELGASQVPGASVVASSDSLSCGYCETRLCGIEENWRIGAVVAAERAIEEEFEARRMYVRSSVHAPPVVLREYYCAACAGALAVDVVTVDHPTLEGPLVGPPGGSGRSV